MPEEKKPVITVVGLRQAKQGFSFLNVGPLKACQKCELFKICGEKLEIGRVYVVTKVRDKVFPCKVHEESVCIVEVIEPSIETCIENRLAFPCGIITFHPPTCNETKCPSYEKCIPQGLRCGDKCKILEVRGQSLITCSLNRHLVSAILQRMVS